MGNRLFAASALVAVVTVALVVRGPAHRGPLETYGGTGTAIRIDPGESFHDATGVLVNGSDRPLDLISVHLLGVVGKPPGTLRVAAAGDPGRPRVAAGEGLPSPAYARRSLTRIEGFRLAPHSEAVLMNTGRLQDGERFGSRGYAVVYRAGKFVYRTALRIVFAACAAPRERCDPSPLMDRLFAGSRRTG